MLRQILYKTFSSLKNHGGLCKQFSRHKSSVTLQNLLEDGKLRLMNRGYDIDHMTNISPKIVKLLESNLHTKKKHPLYHLRQQIITYMYQRYRNARGNPLFSVHDGMSPIVTTKQNFDSLLIPQDHVSRSRSDTYYINKEHVLRTHTSAHQYDLIKSGLDNFIAIGDVYRRDVVDKSHFVAFHQAEGVRLYSHNDIFGHLQDPKKYTLFENRSRSDQCQGVHTDLVVDLLSYDLKGCLEGLAKKLFGKDLETRWVDAYFPFTHPSWELEVYIDDDWMELLGCGIIEQEILHNAGAEDKVGWAFGLGLERWAMALYKIPDIRLFWSKDPGFQMQFDFDDSNKQVTYKSFSKQNPLYFDISFWLPKDSEFVATDFYDIIHNVGNSIVENVKIIDEFVHPKTGLKSVCFRLIYRHHERQLSKEEIKVVHSTIERLVESELEGTLRIKK